MLSHPSATSALLCLTFVALGGVACNSDDTELGSMPSGSGKAGSGGAAATGGAGGAPGSGGGAATPGSGGTSSTASILSQDGPIEALRVSGDHVYYVKWLAPSGQTGHSIRRIPKVVKTGAPLPTPQILFDVPLSKDWVTPKDFSIGFELDATHIYFVDNVDENDAVKQPGLRRILRASLAGGAATSIVDELSTSAILDHIEVEGGHVYYVIDGDLKRVPADGSGPAVTVHDGASVSTSLTGPGPGASMFAISKGSIFICPFEGSTVFRLPIAGGTLEGAAHVPGAGGGCTDIAATTTNTYGLLRESPSPLTLQSTLFEGPLTPPAPPLQEGATLAAQIGHAAGMRVDGGFLYYISEEGQIPTLVRRDPKSGAVKQLAAEMHAYPRLGYDFDATHIYVIEGQYQLRRMPK